MDRVAQTKAVAKFAWGDLKRFTTLFLACTTVLGAYHGVRIRYGDPRDYYTYQGVEGPFAPVIGPDGTFIPGEPITSAHAGDTFGWRSTGCLAAGVTARAVFQFERVAEGGGPNVPAAPAREIVSRPADHRCGPKVVWQDIPSGTPPGLYEESRTIHLRETSMWPLVVELPPVRLQVLQPLDR